MLGTFLIVVTKILDKKGKLTLAHKLKVRAHGERAVVRTTDAAVEPEAAGHTPQLGSGDECGRSASFSCCFLKTAC